MSNLESVVQSQLQTRKQFTFLGSDGCIVQAHNYDGVLAVHVTDPEGKTLFDHYTEFKVLLRHLELQAGTFIDQWGNQTLALVTTSNKESKPCSKSTQTLESFRSP